MSFNTGQQSERMFLSAPHRVRFAGFVATTPQLQQMGWQLSAEQDFMRDAIRLALRHEDLQLVAITTAISFYQMAMRNHPSPSHRIISQENHLTFDIVRMGPMNSTYVEWRNSDLRPGVFSPIDAKTQFIDSRISKFEDLVIFAPALVETQEIIVDENEVSSILAKLVEAQRPEQERIRARQRLRESREGLELGAEPRRNFHAQILSIAA